MDVVMTTARRKKTEQILPCEIVDLIFIRHTPDRSVSWSEGRNLCGAAPQGDHERPYGMGDASLCPVSGALQEEGADREVRPLPGI